MKLRLEDKTKAIKLRIQGRTYREIRTAIPNLSKSTLSGWLKNFRLTPGQKAKLEQNIYKIGCDARMKAGWTKRQIKQKKIESIFMKSTSEYQELADNRLFLTGLVLYWGEGNKKTEMFQFTNSDPQAISVMMKWLIEICQIPKEKIKIRLYIHTIYAHENCEEFWSKVVKIPTDKFSKTIYKPTIHRKKKNPAYKGCVQLRVLKTDFYWKVMGWLRAITKDNILYKRP